MALTRKLLNGMGLTPEQVDSIIENHTETVDAIKAERDQYKADADKLPSIQKQLDDLKAETDGGKNPYKVKYEAIKEEFEKHKAEAAAKETRASKESALRAMLKKIGVAEKRIDAVVKVSDVDALKLDNDGNLEDAKELEKSYKAEWADFIPVVSDVKHTPDTPLNNVSGTKLTKADIYKKDNFGRYVLSDIERQKAIAENPDFMKG